MKFIRERLKSEVLSRRAPQGARGLKCEIVLEGVDHARRAPQGARGLKCGLWVLAEGLIYVAPRKGRVG